MRNSVQANAAMPAKRTGCGSGTRATVRCTSRKQVKYGRCASARGYRALGLLKGETMHWFWIGRHDEYERIFKR
jgi:hypothetical protein